MWCSVIGVRLTLGVCVILYYYILLYYSYYYTLLLYHTILFLSSVLSSFLLSNHLLLFLCPPLLPLPSIIPSSPPLLPIPLSPPLQSSSIIIYVSVLTYAYLYCTTLFPSSSPLFFQSSSSSFPYSSLSFLYLSPIHSIRVGTYITLFIFRGDSWDDNLTPHVLSEWMVEV